ncbi:MAG: enoyl-CoA hydratase/isomerase family protein, partial [Myxococcota bacterium]
MKAGRAEPAILSLAELVDGLASAYAPEKFSTLSGSGILIVDLPAEEGKPWPTGRLESTAAALAELACPTIALAGGTHSPGATSLIPAFDVVLEGGLSLNPLLDCIQANPLASLALVQLLRHNEKADVHQGLMAESLVYSVLQSGPEFRRWTEGRAEPGVPDAGEPAVLAEREGASLCLRFNRPARHNAFGVAMRDGLAEGLQLALSDPAIKEVVLRGEGPSFCSGGDLAQFGSFPDPATAHAVRSTRNVGRMLHALADKTRAEVHGACIGAGVELPAFVHRVSAREDAFFQLPEIEMGLVPGAGGTVSLLRRIGRQRTAWLALTGERIEVERALRWGVVDEITPADGSAAA